MEGLQTRLSLLLSLGCQVPSNGAACPTGGQRREWPLPEALGYQPKEGHITAPPLRVCFLQLHDNAASIVPLDLYFSKHFRMCGLVLFYIKLTTSHRTRCQLGIQFCTRGTVPFPKFCLCSSNLVRKGINLKFVML